MLLLSFVHTCVILEGGLRPLLKMSLLVKALSCLWMLLLSNVATLVILKSGLRPLSFLMSLLLWPCLVFGCLSYHRLVPLPSQKVAFGHLLFNESPCRGLLWPLDASPVILPACIKPKIGYLETAASQTVASQPVASQTVHDQTRNRVPRDCSLTDCSLPDCSLPDGA